MKIRDVRTVGLRVPLPRVFEGGTYRVTERATIITEIVTDDGVAGRMYSGDTRGEAQALVRAATGVAVTAGQSERSAMQVRDLVDGRAIDHCNVDASHAGGPTEWRRAAAYCALHDVQIAHHEEPQIAMHLLASVPNGGYVECFPNPDRDPLWATLIANRPPIHDGIIELPKGPGFGLDFDPDVIARHNVDR